VSYGEEDDIRVFLNGVGLEEKKVEEIIDKYERAMAAVQEGEGELANSMFREMSEIFDSADRQQDALDAVGPLDRLPGPEKVEEMRNTGKGQSGESLKEMMLGRNESEADRVSTAVVRLREVAEDVGGKLDQLVQDTPENSAEVERGDIEALVLGVLEQGARMRQAAKHVADLLNEGEE
jgi:hypothetical protein